MNAIFKKENVYVAVKGKDFRDDINIDEVDSLIFSPEFKYKKNEVSLYGGRVFLHFYNSDLTMSIDGVHIRLIKNNDNGFWFPDSISLEAAVAFLNQIENLGVDSFLDNYKNQLKGLKKEIEGKKEKLEQEQAVQYDEKKTKIINSLNNIINLLTCIIFSLLINMNAGVDNHVYTEAYNEIINLYF